MVSAWMKSISMRLGRWMQWLMLWLICYLLNELQVDQILASPVRVGYGHVKCAHGILPVPAPATAYLMKEIPMYAGDLEGEFCTPTGAALLKHFVKKYEQSRFCRWKNQVMILEKRV